MKTHIKKITLGATLLILTTNLLAQLDTTKWYPLETGNIWEYYNSSFGEYLARKVYGDTTLENEKTYKIIRYKYLSDDWEISGFERIEDGKYYRYVQGQEACDSKEDLLYNFNVPDSSIWMQCNQFFAMGENETNYNGLIRTYRKYEFTVNQELTTKEFTTVIIDSSSTPPDTIWNPLFGHGWITISRGIGRTRMLGEGTDWELRGAYIDGKLYGTIILDVEETKSKRLPHGFSLQLYPNPTNSITNIIIKGEAGKQVDLSLYNMLGEKIETVYKGYLRNSMERFLWNSDNAVSGIYIVVLRSANLTVTNKITVIK